MAGKTLLFYSEGIEQSRPFIIKITRMNDRSCESRKLIYHCLRRLNDKVKIYYAAEDKDDCIPKFAVYLQLVGLLEKAI